MADVAPTLAQAERVLTAREVGARPAEPFAPRPLGRGRWAVQAVAFMSLQPMGEIVLAPRDGGCGWRAERPERVSAPEAEAMFAAEGALL